MRTHRPIPRNREIKVGSKDFLVSKTDEKGNILYVNDTFCDVTGYDEVEVLGQPHNILRHPDMPAVIFFLMWKKIKSGKNIRVLIKNLARSGEYYWVSTDFEIHGKNAQSYIAFRRGVSASVIETVEPLYAHLLKVEKAHGLEASLVYLEGFLQEKHMTFDEYMDFLLKPKGLMAVLFNQMKNFFIK